MSVYIFLFETQSIKCIFFFFCFELYSLFYDTPTKRAEWVIFYWTVLEVKNSGAQVAWANKPTTYIHIPVEVK